VIEARHEREAPVVFVELRRDPADLARVLRTAIAAGDVRLVVDLGEREDATSDDLTLLHRASKQLRRLGGCLAVVTAHPDLRRLFDVTLLSHAFPVFASRDEALRDLR
jgi:anti-anti-sigma factor